MAPGHPRPFLFKKTKQHFVSLYINQSHVWRSSLFRHIYYLLVCTLLISHNTYHPKIAFPTFITRAEVGFLILFNFGFFTNLVFKNVSMLRSALETGFHASVGWNAD